MAETTIREKLGIGEALLNDPIYGAELRKVFELWKAGKTTEAEDAFFKTAWANLDSDVQDRYLLKLENEKVYKERLKSWLIRIKKDLAAKGIKADDETLKKYYDDGIDDDTVIDELTGGISAKGAAGEAADALDKLRTTARLNGFNLEKDFGNQLDGWLQRISRGESVDDFSRLIRAQAKLGLPEKVGTLLDEGLDLANIFAPYRNTMAKLLEITPDSISLDDPVLRSAYGQDKEMSIYDFQRAVRKDPRWQYTDNAREEVSNAALGILRDFGFQG
jgi:tetratricopeptide (TPR) repeat protein